MATTAMRRKAYAFGSSEGSAFSTSELNARDFSIQRLIVQGPETLWSENVTTKLNELSSLPIGWDGYRGCPVLFEVAHFSMNLLHSIFVSGVSVPSLVPGSDGSLQIEWHEAGYDIELDVIGVNQVTALRRNVVTSEEEELTLTNDFLEVRNWILILAGRAQDAVATAA